MKKVSIRIKQPDLPILEPFKLSETFTLEPVKDTLQNIKSSLKEIIATRKKHGV